MKHDPIRTGKRKAVNVSIDTGIVAAAKEVGINMSRIAEDAIRSAVKAEQAKQWSETHRDKMEAWNDWFEANGMPFEELRVWP